MSDKKAISNTVYIDRLRELIDAKSSRQEIASDPIMDCDVSLITKHYNGDRAVTIDYLKKYCEYFKVSADYLLGLTDSEMKVDDPQRYVADYIGLDDDAVEFLHFMKDQIWYSTRTIDFDLKMTGFLSNENDFRFDQVIDIQKHLKNDIVIDECMRCFLVSASNCCYISQFVKFACESFSTEYLQHTPNFMLRHDINLLGRYLDLYDLQLFKAQQAIVDYIREIAPVTDSESIEKYIDEVINQIRKYLCEVEADGND